MSTRPIIVDSRSVTTVAVGYICFGLSSIIGSLADVGWYRANFGHGIELMKALALLDVTMAFLAYWNRQAFDSITLFAKGASTWSFQAAATLAPPTAVLLNVTRPVNEPLSYEGWFFFLWAVFLIAIWLGSFRAGLMRQVVLGTAALSGVLAAFGCWWSIAILQPTVGWIDIGSGILAIALGGTALWSFGRDQDPNFPSVESSRN